MNVSQTLQPPPPQTPLDISGQLKEFRIEIIKRTALAVVSITGVAGWLVLSLTPFPFASFLVLLVLFGLGLTVRDLSSTHPTRARYLMLVVSMLGPVTLMLTSVEPWVPFIVLPFVFVGSLMVHRGEWIMAGAFLLATYTLHTLGWRQYPITGFLVSLALTVSISWVVIYMINTSLEWYQSMLSQSNRLLHETREHRGELSKVVKALKLATDLQRRTEQELILARHSAEEARLMKERFAARVSHELRTPMALIHGFSEVMYNSPEIYGDVTWTPTMRRDIAQIYRSSRHMLAMIDDILNLSRFEMTGFAINLEDTPIATLIGDAASIAKDLFSGPAVNFETDIPPDLPVLKIDRTRIRQVILNLVNNARRFTETGFVRVTASQTPHEVLISVCDTGPGIPADKLELIFQEFYQVDDTVLRNRGGTGLGLTICKNFVEIHGGHIWAESTVGQGSTFTFSLPRVSPLLNNTLAEGGKLEDHPADSLRLVVLGADEYILAMLRSFFSDYEIVSVSEPALLGQAVALYHPQAVLVNCMPGVDDTLDLLPDMAVPVIQFSLPSARWLVDRVGIQACLSKPVTSEQIQREIDRVGSVKRVLVIDDDANFSQLIERLLQSLDPDMQVLTINEGQRGLAQLFADPPDLVFLDLSMPDLDGFSIIQAVKAEPSLRSLPLVLLTASLHPEHLISWSDNRILIHRRGDLRPQETLEILKSALGVLKPSYDETTDDILTKLKL